MELPELPHPICDVCDKPVDRVVVGEDIYRDEKIISVFCHGARETVRIPELMFVAAERVSFDGRAFSKVKTLPRPEHRISDELTEAMKDFK